MHDKKKKGKNTNQVESNMCLLKLSFFFGVTWLVKQIIKCNGLGGWGSFISEGKNKVPDDLGGFWSWIGWEFP